MFTTTPSSTQARTAAPGGQRTVDAWLLWRPETRAEPELLTVAELAECHCPELCDRDHDNE
ncbi:MAG TPA: hypothetical protein VMP86_07110 [Candidatus Binatia bacterium]|nr:hypothetical protein [Candidatus Binatia bacterium]